MTCKMKVVWILVAFLLVHYGSIAETDCVALITVTHIPPCTSCHDCGATNLLGKKCDISVTKPSEHQQEEFRGYQLNDLLFVNLSINCIDKLGNKWLVQTTLLTKTNSCYNISKTSHTNHCVAFENTNTLNTISKCETMFNITYLCSHFRLDLIVNSLIIHGYSTLAQSIMYTITNNDNYNDKHDSLLKSELLFDVNLTQSLYIAAIYDDIDIMYDLIVNSDMFLNDESIYHNSYYSFAYYLMLSNRQRLSLLMNDDTFVKLLRLLDGELFKYIIFLEMKYYFTTRHKECTEPEFEIQSTSYVAFVF